ncbi:MULTISPECIES: hypothetical protein [Bacteroides]|mgnify:FL=1|jgi:hypothetical protein|uniref:hypothetical protein n=1 Tax=Bacteroides TaxID=816 RepID=UPI000E51A845|nr:MULTISPECIES: hypothetical protein [Bacteroides]MCS3201188.1 hypothetical protein [Candidatus Bacteroides intestinigallinarum]QNL40757.1 hypothetical protein H8796_09320 [Bacteroides sp. M10]RGQ98887.1 hypothetical protein DWY71_11060 [Bacteroides sp. AF26-7BH]RGY31735.1 hypothetical protein DXA46_16370 [Bacteroides sp. OF02-3LB]
MIRKIYTLLMLGLCLGFAACSDDNDGLDPNSAAPVIKFPMEQLDVDLNKVDNLPVVAVIKSQAGLQSVTMKLQTVEGVTEYKTVTEFFNPNSYSLSENLEYNANYEAFIIEATDKLNHVTSGTLPIAVTDVMARPVITFDPEEIIYDEMDENPVMPRTTFKIVSEAGLKKVERFLVSVDGQTSKGGDVLNGDKIFEYDELIEYKEGDKGFKVKAEDIYGNITISTLQVSYKTVPVPVLTLGKELITTDEGVDTEVPMHIESVRGIREVVIYRIEKGIETEILRKGFSGDKNLDYNPKVQLTEETSQIKIVVSDGREGKDVNGTVKTYVSMEVVDLQVGSQKMANAEPFALISLKDMKTYSVDEAIVSEESAKNIDIKFYAASNSGVITFRLYSPENVDGKNGEYAGSTGKLTALKKMNMTRFAKLSNFDYEQATRSSIEEEFGKATTAARADVNVGDIIGFKTGGSSSAGGGRIGVIKIVDISDKMGTDATKRIATVEIKFPKQK